VATRFPLSKTFLSPVASSAASRSISKQCLRWIKTVVTLPLFSSALNAVTPVRSEEMAFALSVRTSYDFHGMITG